LADALLLHIIYVPFTLPLPGTRAGTPLRPPASPVDRQTARSTGAQTFPRRRPGTQPV